jgi:diguanylate cyclase (GGDEF)-like protein
MISLIQIHIDVMCAIVLGICYLIFRSNKEQVSVNLVRCNNVLILACLSDIARCITQSMGWYNGYFFSLELLFSSFAGCAALWMRFTAAQAFMKLPRWNSPRNIILMAPLALYVAFCMTDFWHLRMFSVAPDCTLIRTPLFFFLGVVCFGYLMTALIVVGYQYLLGESAEQRHKGQVLFIFTTGTIMGGAMQYVTNMQWTLACSTVCIVFYIVTVHEDMIFRDHLSGLNTRSRFKRYLSEHFEQLRALPESYMLFMDIDHFKEINDRYGHVNGDRAIRVVGKIMTMLAQDQGAFTARFGGDEFVALIPSADSGFIDRCSDMLNSYAELETASMGYEFNISLSVGCVKIALASDPDELFELADDEMYRQKIARRERSRNNDGGSGSAGAQGAGAVEEGL